MPRLACKHEGGPRNHSLGGRFANHDVTVDLSPVPGAGMGSDVTLWGHANANMPDSDVLSIDEVAQAAGTVGYELMCALAPRVPVAAV